VQLVSNISKHVKKMSNQQFIQYGETKDQIQNSTNLKI